VQTLPWFPRRAETSEGWAHPRHRRVQEGQPVEGIFVKDYDPIVIAFHYVLGGASCLSVLTDEQFFFGSLDDLKRVREAVTIPIIRKDFIIDERQIAEARLAGADAILLIVACLEDGQLADLQGFARDIGLDVLVEVHDADEAMRAVQLGADPIGVNNRNLKDFSVSLDTTFQLLTGIAGNDRVVVSESGIANREDCRRLEAAGVDAVLVGEALMTAKDPVAELKKLRGDLSTAAL
jgi:indole-3-glycerol phosphate synthase